MLRVFATTPGRARGALSARSYHVISSGRKFNVKTANQRSNVRRSDKAVSCRYYGFFSGEDQKNETATNKTEAEPITEETISEARVVNILLKDPFLRPSNEDSIVIYTKTSVDSNRLMLPLMWPLMGVVMTGVTEIMFPGINVYSEYFLAFYLGMGVSNGLINSAHAVKIEYDRAEKVVAVTTFKRTYFLGLIANLLNGDATLRDEKNLKTKKIPLADFVVDINKRSKSVTQLLEDHYEKKVTQPFTFHRAIQGSVIPIIGLASNLEDVFIDDQALSYVLSGDDLPQDFEPDLQEILKTNEPIEDTRDKRGNNSDDKANNEKKN